LSAITKLNELLCPDCDTRMTVIYDTDDKYGAHACFKCRIFHTLENPQDFER